MQVETLSNQYGNIKQLLKEDLKYLYANMQGRHIYNTKVNTKVALFWAVTFTFKTDASHLPKYRLHLLIISYWHEK
jgi:hypothetical protein